MSFTTAPVFECHDLKRVVQDRAVLSGINFRLEPRTVLFVRGPSGVGKSLLLRSLACLDPLQGGTVQLGGTSSSQMGVPKWRARVGYVHQARVNFSGTPLEFFAMVRQFKAQNGRRFGDLAALVRDMGMEEVVLSQQWAELSGGQAQRVSLAISLALCPDVLLLDEPTSACDHESSLKVEAVLKNCGSTLVWVTHDDTQPLRIGGLQLELPHGTLSPIAVPGSSMSSQLS